jgi:hypothetical protein
MARWTGLRARTGEVEWKRVAVAGLIVLHFAIFGIDRLGWQLGAVSCSWCMQREFGAVHSDMSDLLKLSTTFTTSPTTASRP